MKVTLLGTSAAEGWPGLFCDCAACVKARELGGKNIRSRSSALIDDVLKIDFPPDIFHQVVTNNVDLRKMKALLFTHAHDDHCSPAELQYMSEYFVTKPPFPGGLPVLGPKDVIDRLESSLEIPFVSIVTRAIEPWNTVRVAGYAITPILAQHDPKQTCYNYIIEDRGGARLLYATDTGWYEEPTWEFLAETNLDAVVIECTKGPVEGGYPAHLSIPDVVRTRQRLIASGTINPACTFVTTHHSHLGGLLHAELECALTPHGVQAGYDGMSFEVPAG